MLSSANVIAGFWRRLFAFVIDLILLGVAGSILGFFFFDALAELGPWGRLLGFVIALLYFGLQDSRFCHGQTLGKRWMKVRVVDADSRCLDVGRAFLRSAVVCVPYFLNNAALPQHLVMSFLLGTIVSLLIFGVGLSLVYLYIFNRKTRQSLQDLLVGSFVINTNVTSAPPKLPLWRWHYVIVAIILLVAMGLPFFVYRLKDASPFRQLLAAQAAILEEPSVTTASINTGATVFRSIRQTATKTTYTTSVITLRHRINDGNSLANRIASIILGKIPEASNMDVVAVNIRYGYDIGIASAWKATNYAFSPTQWKQRISK